MGLVWVLGLIACGHAPSTTSDSGATGASASVQLPGPAVVVGSPRAGYYRYPAIHGDTIVFTSEGDLWEVGAEGGAARRLTSGAGSEILAAISPDGKTVAFSASYEGPRDVYTMPIGGGTPRRMTWDGEGMGTEPYGDEVAGYTPDGRILVRTQRYSTLPDPKLVAIDADGNREIVPLAQASEGAYADDGKTLFFTRLPRQGSQTKRYQGGTAENLWRYDAGHEAVPLTADFAGTSHNPMFWNGRVYFLSTRSTKTAMASNKRRTSASSTCSTRRSTRDASSTSRARTCGSSTSRRARTRPCRSPSSPTSSSCATTG
jgi:tricorn protease-like protein